MRVRGKCLAFTPRANCFSQIGRDDFFFARIKNHEKTYVRRGGLEPPSVC